MPKSSASDRDSDTEEQFDLEEFRALRQEILQKVAASSRLEVFAVTGAAAIYAWLMTHGGAIAQAVWYIPVLLPFLGFMRAMKLGKQMVIAGNYLQLLETRLRANELAGCKGELVGRGIHGWEAYVHQRGVWEKFRDRAGLFFWISFMALTIALPCLLLPR